MSLHLPHRRALLAATALPAFSLDAYMASQSDGFWFDFTKTDRLFQEDVGPTPADDPNEVIGLALSLRTWNGQTLAQVVAGASELVPAGNWNPLSNGILSNQSQGGFRLQSDASDDIAMAQKEYSGFVVGRTYKVSVAWSGSNCDTNIIRVSNAAITGPGSIINASISASAASREYYFTATATTLYFGVAVIRAAFSADITVSGFTIKEVTRYAGIQTTASYKPKFQTGGAAFDGLDDNLLTGYKIGAAANFLVAKTTVPATLSANQTIIGASDGSAANPLFLGVRTDGRVAAAVGGLFFSAQYGGPDLRGQTAVVALSVDGSTVTLYVNGEAVYSGAQSGAPSTANGLAIGSYNAASFYGGFYGGAVAHALAGREALTPSRALQIANALQ